MTGSINIYVIWYDMWHFRYFFAKTFTSSTAVGKVFAASCELYILQTKCSKKSKNQVQKIYVMEVKRILTAII